MPFLIPCAQASKCHLVFNKPEYESNLLREMRKNVPFPRRPVAAVLPQTERREIRVPIDKFSRLVFNFPKSHQ